MLECDPLKWSRVHSVSKCTMNTETNDVSFVLNLVPSVRILGDKEIYVKSGSAVTLRCLISNCLEEPSFVFWYFTPEGKRNATLSSTTSWRILDDSDR